MKRYCIIFLAVISALSVSCRDHNVGSMRPVRLVEELIADTSSYERHQLIEAGKANNHGTIAVVGEPRDVMLVSECLLTCDFHDNISGRYSQDGLPDFSGETVDQILDEAGAPYDRYLEMNGEEAFRTLNVRNLLRSVDTVSLANTIDSNSFSYRQRAKVVVFASPLSSMYGHFDADTLCRNLGARVKVLSPVQAVTDYASARHEKPIDIIVWDDGTSGKRYPSSYDGARFHSFTPAKDTLGDVSSVREKLLCILDMYMEAGNSERIEAMVLDDSDIPAGLVDEAVSEILSADDDALLIYRNILDPDFECMTSAKAIAEACYGYLREANSFTHRIAYPELRSHFTAMSVDGLVEFKDTKTY